MNQYIAIMSRKDGGTRITFMAASLVVAQGLMAARYPGVSFDWIGACPKLRNGVPVGRAGQSLIPR